jgi:hypothetical protein
VATTTLAGNSGNNTLNASGLESTLVQGFGGADTITLSRRDDNAQAGEGNDTIGLSVTGTQINDVRGGKGNDSITFLSATVFTNTVGGGEGNDLITFGVAGDASLISAVQVAANQGNDTVSLTSGARTVVNSYIGLGQGNDSIYIGSGSTLTSTDIFGGMNKDTIDLTGLGGSTNTINGGEGSDRLIIGTGALVTAKIGAGKGTDSIFFETGAVVTGSVAGGGLNDTISFAGGIAGAVRIYGDANGVTTVGTGTGGGADGADLIGSTTSEAGSASIYGGGGADTITVNSGSGLILGGNGSDSIVLNSNGATTQTVNGGAGTDVLRINTGADTLAGLSTLNGGDGNDTVQYAGKAYADTNTAAKATSKKVASGNFNVIAAGVSAGDVIKFSGTVFVATTATGNWLTNAAPALYVYSASTQAISKAGTKGDIGVFSDGSDTYFVLTSSKSATTLNGYYRAVVKGVDLVNTTVAGTSVAFNSTNFGFTLAQNNTTNDSGLVITIS